MHAKLLLEDNFVDKVDQEKERSLMMVEDWREFERLIFRDIYIKITYFDLWGIYINYCDGVM